MRVTVDANILFSALLRKGITRKIWFGLEMELFAPRFLLEEFQKYKGYLQNKFKGTREEFLDLSQKLLSQVKLVSDGDLKPFLPASASLTNDPKDWIYLACALKEDTLIWSDDKEFKSQKRIRILSTPEMKEEFGLL
ncbi:MAG: PIN domain-containing protein [Candidatus Diapherotrites archaeon]